MVEYCVRSDAIFWHHVPVTSDVAFHANSNRDPSMVRIINTVWVPGEGASEWFQSFQPLAAPASSRRPARSAVASVILPIRHSLIRRSFPCPDSPVPGCSSPVLHQSFSPLRCPRPWLGLVPLSSLCLPVFLPNTLYTTKWFPSPTHISVGASDTSTLHTLSSHHTTAERSPKMK